MQITPEHITLLWQRYVDQTATPEEEQALLGYLRQPENEAASVAFLEDYFAISMPSQPIDRAYWQQRLEAIVSAPQAAPVHRVHFLKTAWFRWAAVLILIAGTATFLYRYSEPSTTITKNQQLLTQPHDIPPGGNKAILTLSDGSTIVLDSAANGNLAQQGGAKIIKLDAGALAYSAGTTVSGEVLYNTVSTPKGGQYQITLPDGTKVWLNAASSIRFPTTFVKDRMVEVTGESYLEVAINKDQPFFVKTGETIVQVLGTSFNINSYANEGSIKTTLLEGSVKVSNNAAAVSASSDRQPGAPGTDARYVSSVILKPGQQAQIPTTALAESSDRRTSPQSKTGGDIAVNSNVDIEQALAWKNGMFNFNGSDLKAVMRQLERWYGIEVKYERPAPPIFFKGKMDRGVNLSDVLEFFTNMGVKYRLEDKTLIIL